MKFWVCLSIAMSFMGRLRKSPIPWNQLPYVYEDVILDVIQKLEDEHYDDGIKLRSNPSTSNAKSKKKSSSILGDPSPLDRDSTPMFESSETTITLFRDNKESTEDQTSSCSPDEWHDGKDDIIAEAEVYHAYGLHEQALELLTGCIEENTQPSMKLHYMLYLALTYTHMNLATNAIKIINALEENVTLAKYPSRFPVFEDTVKELVKWIQHHNSQQNHIVE